MAKAMWRVLGLVLSLGMVALFSYPTIGQVQADGPQVSVWVTKPDLSLALSQQPAVSFNGSNWGSYTIQVDDTRQYQSWDGVGGTMTESSAWLIQNKLSESARNDLMFNLFGYGGNAINLNFIRVPVGANDLTVSGDYSLDDPPGNSPDPSLNNFSIQHDQQWLIPTLKQAYSINSYIKFLGSPWSPPGWMKNTGSMNGGWLQGAYYDTYANYLARFVRDYRAAGVPIWGITPQNEPQFSTGNYPSMSIESYNEANFIKNNLGPALQNAGVGDTRILIYDHNWGDQSGGNVVYPQQVLSDSGAYPYITGTAFHCYSGDVSGQKTVANAYPDKAIYFDECSQTTAYSDSFQKTMDGVINVPRNASKSFLMYAIALDNNSGPQNGGCSNCLPIVKIDQNTGSVTYTTDYYALGHLSKFVRLDARNIATDWFDRNGLQSVGFINSDGQKVLIVFNAASSGVSFNVAWNGQTFSYSLDGGAAATFTWY